MRMHILLFQNWWYKINPLSIVVNKLVRMRVHAFKQKFYLVTTKMFKQMARAKTMENWWHNQPRPSSSKDAKYNFKSSSKSSLTIKD